MAAGYDSLTLNLYSHDCPDTDLIQTIPQYLTAIKSNGSSKFGEYVNGYLDSLNIKVNHNKVSIQDSSLCKYYLGDNFKTLTRSDTKRAIEKISDSLHLPFHLANVTRIDFSQNFIMQQPEKVYYAYLGQARYYSRLEQNNGLYYQNGKRQILFYGKEHEQRIKRQPIPELYKDRHVLRYELRFIRQLREQFNLSSITAELLYDEAFYNSLLGRWKDEYLNIQKITSKLNTMKATGSKKQFIENLALFTILDVGQATILGKVKEWQGMGEISKKQAHDLRQCLKHVSSIPKLETDANQLINELTRKVKEAAAY